MKGERRLKHMNEAKRVFEKNLLGKGHYVIPLTLLTKVSFGSYLLAGSGVSVNENEPNGYVDNPINGGGSTPQKGTDKNKFEEQDTGD